MFTKLESFPWLLNQLHDFFLLFQLSFSIAVDSCGLFLRFYSLQTSVVVKFEEHLKINLRFLH